MLTSLLRFTPVTGPFVTRIGVSCNRQSTKNNGTSGMAGRREFLNGYPKYRFNPTTIYVTVQSQDTLLFI